MKLRNKTKMPPLDTKTFENALSDSVVSILNNGASLSFVDLNESVQYCPPQSLPDTICHLNDNIRKDFRYGSTAMPYIDSTIVSMEEIDVDEFDTAASNMGRASSAGPDQEHVTALGQSFIKNGWNYLCERLWVVPIPEWRMAEIRRTDAFSKKKFWLFSGRHRITSLMQLYRQTKENKYLYVPVDIFEYTTKYALNAQAMASNARHLPSKVTEMRDVEYQFRRDSDEGIYPNTPAGFAEFLKVYRLEGTFSDMKQKQMMNRATKKQSYHRIAEIASKTPNIFPNRTYFQNTFNIPFLTSDVRLTDVLRDRMPIDGSTLYVTLFVSGKDNTLTIEELRKKAFEGFDKKQTQMALMRYHENKRAGLKFPSSHPLAGADKETILKHYKQTSSIQFNGFCPQEMSLDNHDMIEKYVVNADGSEFENFVPRV